MGSGAAAARPFLIGERRESRAQIAGRLFVGLNNSGSVSGEGSFKVKITIAGGADDAAKEPSLARCPTIGEKEFEQIPRRVVDKDGNEGDRVNFLIVGTEEQVKQALINVGWVVVDRSVKDTILRGAMGTFSKQAYLTMPMSELMVFGRAQDYGFAMSDPIKTVMARHHFRIWKAPFDVGGLTLWVGAGTHDVGFRQGSTHRRNYAQNRPRHRPGARIHRRIIEAERPGGEDGLLLAEGHDYQGQDRAWAGVPVRRPRAADLPEARWRRCLDVRSVITSAPF